ncbi:hypothetical protein BMETH_2585_0 [methanotrophic bacterial endosymbiont of Bathymodiolus sp.]|nr:hypothetical protein BMETH_2585_0 [methanotrophic bacterial endosymbiont of Bathymodiolus sp.]
MKAIMNLKALKILKNYKHSWTVHKRLLLAFLVTKKHVIILSSRA